MDCRTRQTTMGGAWQEAESAARAKAILHADHRLEMLNTLRVAAHTLGYTGPVRDSLFAFLNQIVERTNDGFGPPWWPGKGEKSILGWPGGPSCSRSKLFDIIADLRDAGILLVVPFQGDPKRSAYAIAWAVVYDMCGKPLPRYLADTAIALQCVPASSAADSHQCVPMNVIADSHQRAHAEKSVHAVDDSVHTVDWPVHAVDKSVHTVDSPPPHAHPPTHACTGARAHVDLILDDDEEQTIIINVKQDDPAWNRLQAAADQMVLDLYRHRRACPSLSRRARVFLASVAFLGEVLGQAGREWVADAVEGVQDFGPDNPSAYLHTCLQNGMEAHLPSGSPEAFELLVRRVRTEVSRWVSKHDWRPEIAFARDRSARAKPAEERPREKSWFELTAAERQSLAREHAAIGGPNRMAEATHTTQVTTGNEP